MIIYFTAISPETKALVSYFGLHRVSGSAISDLFENDDATVRLVQVGTGKLSAAVAVTAYLCCYPPAPDDYFVNPGICACFDPTYLGQSFLALRLMDLSSGKTFLPEVYSVCKDSSFAAPAGALLFTSDRIVSGSEPFDAVSAGAGSPLPRLYDMEAFGIFTALSGRVKPCRTVFYKTVSDSADGTFPSPEAVTSAILAALPSLTEYLSLLRVRSETSEILSDAQNDCYRECLRRFRFTETMTFRLKNLAEYAAVSGISFADFYGRFLAAESGAQRPGAESAAPMPDADSVFPKKTALRFLSELEEYLLSDCPQTPAPSAPEPLHLFDRIYVEHDAFSCEFTRDFLSRRPNAQVIPIDSYKEVLNRYGQNHSALRTEPSFVLAVNRGNLFYPGAPVCQSFAQEHFMYTSVVKNCIYDCDYCYLQGMYPSNHIVVFVNTADYLARLSDLLAKHPVYLCCSYDSDLTALAGLLPQAKAFCDFAAAHERLRLEVRTKCASLFFLRHLTPTKNVIMAYTLSPQPLIDRFEHRTPSLAARLRAAKEAVRLGFTLRLCIDPILDVPGAPELYRDLVATIFTVLSPSEITDISLGVFRISAEYFKQLRESKPQSPIAHYPYRQTDGVCHYGEKRCEALLSSVREALLSHGIKQEQIFTWSPAD